jgi:hypothetical protein
MTAHDLAAIRRIPAQMADKVRAWLPQINEARYLSFLDMMFHYTRKSGERLRHAATQSTHPALRSYLSALADDEQSHYRLAEADLAAFARRPSEEVPAEVARFHQFWSGIKPSQQAAYLGALLSLEGVAAHLGADATRALGGLGLGKQQARFILVHLEADAEHGAQAEALAEELFAIDPVSLAFGAEEAGRFWVEIHRRALSPNPT